VTSDGAASLLRESAAIDFVRDAFGHLKVIGHTAGAKALLEAAGIEKKDEGVIALEGKGAANALVTAAKKVRIWSRESSVRVLP
jgi:catalase